MKIFRKNFSKDELIKKIGDISQLCDVKSYEFIDGVSRGLRAIDMKTACGIDITATGESPLP